MRVNLRDSIVNYDCIRSNAPLSILNCRAHALSRSVPPNRHLRKMSGKLAGNFKSCIGRPVVDDQYAKLGRQFAGQFQQVGYVFSQPRLGIVDRQHDR
jgi:hypothetical protein